MASGMSIYWAEIVLNKMLRSEDFTPPSTLWCAAFLGANAFTNLRNNIITDEVVGNGYQRVEVRGTSGITFTPASSGTSSQTSDISFPAAVNNAWGIVNTLALLDDFGNVYLYGDLTIPKNIVVPNVLRVPQNQWILTL